MTNFKRFLTLFFIVLLAANMWGTDAEYIFNAQDLSGTTLNGAANNSWSISTGTIAGYNATKGIQTIAATLTIASTDQYSDITKVVLDYSTNSSSTAKISVTAGSSTSAEQQVETSKTNATLTFNFSDIGNNKTVSVTMKRNGSSGSLYLKRVIITYGGGTPTHTLSSAVSPTGTGSVTLDATTVAEGSTTTATATANTGYAFSYWSISGTGASLASSTANPATVTMGTANATVTAHFVAKTAASITLSVAGSTSSVPGKYVGDSYTLPSTAAECAGKTFVGWSKVEISTPSATKPTSNYYEKGESVTLAASQTFYAVYATSSAGGGGGSVEVTYDSDNFPTSYGTANTFTKYNLEGYDFYIQQIYKNGDKMQWRASGNSNGTGTIYNDETFPGHISSIVLVYDASDGNKNHTLTIGSSANPSSGTSITPTNDGGTTYTFDCSGYSYDYFVMENGSGAGYTASITINYGGAATYSDYTTECVACATPTLTFANSTLTKYVGDANFTNTLTVTGNDVSGAAITYTSNNTSKADVNSSTGEVTIKQSTIDGTPVIITASRAAASGGGKCDVAVQQTYTLIIKNRINWIANEVATTAGSPTTEANYNGTIDAIPTNPAVPSACSTKSFVGWTTIADWDSDDAPDPLYTSLSDFSSLKIQENKTFYAVFANATTGDPVSTKTQTLEYDTWSYTGTTTDKDTYRLFGNGAYIYSAAFDLSKLSQVVVCGGTFGGDSYNDISIQSASGTEWATEEFTSTNAKKEYTITSSTPLSGTQALRIYSESGNGTSTGVRISKVEIYTMETPTVGTAYVTKCCNDWADPTLTYDKYSIEVGEANATKSLSGTTHGTLSFSSSNTSIATVDPSTGAVHAVSPGNVTITANWTKDGSWCAKSMPINFTITGDVTITFDANGSTGSMASQVVSYATTTSLNSMSGLTAPTGKTFIGWNTQANGKGDSYADGAIVKFTTNTTLYAQWGTAYTITLHRHGATQEITLLNTQFPYTLPTAESDYCDAWQFDGWSASAVADNSTSYEKVIKATTAEDAHFYAVYRGDSYSTEAFARISSADQLTSGAEYIFVANSANKKYVLTNTFTTANYNYGEMTTTETAESGKGFFFSSVIPAYSIYYISGSEDNWEIKNKAQNKYINLANADNLSYDWYTTYSTNRTYKITPNGLYWTVESNASVTKKYLDATKKDTPARVVFTVYQYHSGALMIYKKGTATAYHYTSTPSGEGCALPCTDCGAQFTYPSMEKSISSKPFSNPIVYTGTPNTATKAFSSNDDNVAEVNPTTGEVTVKGIGEVTITMTQLRDNTDPSHPVCGITISYDITVTSPSLEVVEVTGDDKIIVEHDFDGITKAEVDSSKLDIKGTIADDIFISKYYEAASEMKLIGLYNGTLNPIDLSQLRIRTSKNGGIWGGSDNHGEAYLGNIVKLGEDYPDFLLPPFTEIVLWSNNESGDNNGGNAQLCYCVNMEVDKKKYNYDDMTAGKVPNWYRIGSTTGGTDSDGNKTFNFNGDDAIIMERSTDNWATWTAIDLFGAGTADAPISDPTGSGNGYVQKIASINDNPGGWYWDATSAAGKELSTNRFYLTRLSTVHSGLDAVEKNATSFVTLGEEWKGEGIGGGTNMDDYCGSGELFSEVATYDFAKYYTDYVEYKDKFTASDNGDGTFTLQFNPGELEKLSCKKIKISVQDALDNTKSAEVEYRVPIIVTSGSSTTTDALFNKHDKDECKICDVAILDGAVLTKSKPSTPAEVAADREQMYNIDVYGGGELYIPTGTTYNINTLTVRSKGDAVGVVDVQGKLTRNNTTLIHYKRFHNEGSDWRWYYFSLPYDCDVSTVTYSNGDPAVHGVDFEIDWYDGEHRASSQANGNWRSIASHPEFPNMIKAGYGYTIAVEEKTGHKNVSLLFPMANFTEATQIDVPVGNWGAGDDGVEVNHKGWNVVGNPFLTRYKAQEDLDINGELRTGILEVNAGGGWTQTPNGVNYATVPQNGGQSGYTQEALTNRNFNPFQSFIIQVGGDAERNDLAVKLKNIYKNKRSSIVRRAESEYETGETTPVWLRLNLNNANEETDQTTILISDKYTAEYDMQFDLAKWRGTNYKSYTQPVLSSVYGGHELAFDALPDSIVEDRVPLTYYSRNAGKMAFELSSAYNWQALEEVILHDVVLETQHNLLTNGKYEFHSNAGEISNRFYISAKVNRRKTPAIATGVDLVDMKNVQLTVQERTIHINGLEPGTQVYVFDMSGRLVGRQVATIAYMNFNVPAFGVYNIRLIGQKAGTTLRALVHQ